MAAIGSEPERPLFVVAGGGILPPSPSMAAIGSEPATGSCSHCGKDIPASNIQLHYAHCSRNLERCEVCGDMVPKRHADEHYYNNHAPVHCSLCSATVERQDLALHMGEKCPRRIVTCDSCHFPLPAADLAEHQVFQGVCGDRTVFCDTCNSYVRLRELLSHELQFHHSSNGASGSSRRAGNAAEREGGSNRRRRQAPQAGHDAAPRWRIMVPIAVTGVAIAICSLFLQKKMDTQQQQQQQQTQ